MTVAGRVTPWVAVPEGSGPGWHPGSNPNHQEPFSKLFSDGVGVHAFIIPPLRRNMMSRPRGTNASDVTIAVAVDVPTGRTLRRVILTSDSYPPVEWGSLPPEAFLEWLADLLPALEATAASFR